MDDIIEEVNHLKATKLERKVFEQNALLMEGQVSQLAKRLKFDETESQEFA